MYDINDGAFLTFKPEMLQSTYDGRLCGCLSPLKCVFDEFVSKYQVGNCITLKLDTCQDDICTVCYIEEINTEEEVAILRRFFRPWEIYERKSGDIINELLWSNYSFEFTAFEQVIRKCHVEFIQRSSMITMNELPINLRHRGAGEQVRMSINEYVLWII